MELNSYFTDFLSKIRPTEAQTKELKEAHTRLRERLLADEYLGPMIVSVFLQGSYRRSTSIRPQGDDKLDVDLVAVTRFRRQDYPVADDVMNEFTSFLNKHYKGQVEEEGTVHRHRDVRREARSGDRCGAVRGGSPGLRFRPRVLHTRRLASRVLCTARVPRGLLQGGQRGAEVEAGASLYP